MTKEYTNGEVKEAERIGIEVENLAEWNAHEESEEGQNKKAELTLNEFNRAYHKLVDNFTETAYNFLKAKLEGHAEASVRAWELEKFVNVTEYELASDFKRILMKNLKSHLRDQKIWGKD